MIDLQLIKTEDGSHSLYVPSLSEHYHSTHGAIQESQHVFIKPGFIYSSANIDIVNLLEIGMGTGLNVYLTYLENCTINKIVHYEALEPNPISEKISVKLNYSDITGKNDDIFQLIHSSKWEKKIDFGIGFYFEKTKNNIQNISLNKKYNLIYFDAFAPDKQPEMWTLEIFEKLFNHMNSNGVLVTYCAKGIVKRVLKKAGFLIESIPGPPGKREMTRAIRRS